jgi:uncharacterized membrane protein YraQ (UPF0718 family)
VSAEPLVVPDPDRRRALLTGMIGVAVLAVLLILGLMWAKWLPYLAKAGTLSDTRTWSGSPIFSAAGQAGSAPSVTGALRFARDYGEAIWRALLVALLVAAAVDALVPRNWLLAVLGRRGRGAQVLSGGLASLPSMMCTCCTAPVAVGLRRRGTPLAASLAYWLGNPLLNPAVLVFLALVLPWPYVATRIVVGAALVFGASALLARLLERSPSGAASTVVAAAEGRAAVEDSPRLRDLPPRYLRSLARFTLVLVPEYAVVVLALGVVSATLSDFGGLAHRLDLLAVVLAAVVATLLVIPTGGEIPVILAALSAGAGLGMAGVLLVALPALSLPSMVMVGRALGWRATWASAGVVLVGGLVSGALLAVLG